MHYIQQLINSYEGGMSIRLIQTDIAGVSNARNLGIDASKGEFIAFIDDDDFISNNYLINLLNTIKDDRSIAEANVLNYQEDTKQTSTDYLTKAFFFNQGKKNISLFCGRSFLSTVCCKLIPKACISDSRFDTDFKIGEDSLFMAEISKRIKHIQTAPTDTYYYRRLRADSASRTKKSSIDIWKNSINLLRAYLTIYLSDFRSYNFLFFCTRFVAVLMKFFHIK